jgi:hypothetical protein
MRGRAIPPVAGLLGTVFGCTAPQHPVRESGSFSTDTQVVALNDSFGSHHVGTPVAERPQAPTLSSLVLPGGRTLTFENDLSEGERYSRHVDQGTLPRVGYIVVERRYEEGSDYLLIHPQSGHQTTLDVLPEISPDGERLLIATNDLEGHEPNLLQIWRVSPQGLVREFEMQTARWQGAQWIGWRASNARWLDSHTVAFTKSGVADDGYIEDLPFRLVFRRAGWVLEPGL